MTDDNLFRLILLALFSTILPFALYHRIRSHTDETLDRWQEGTFILFGTRLSGIPCVQNFPQGIHIATGKHDHLTFRALPKVLVSGRVVTNDGHPDGRVGLPDEFPVFVAYAAISNASVEPRPTR